MTIATHNQRTLQTARRLVRKHFFRIVSATRDPSLNDLFAITFRPGDRTETFNGKLRQRAGKAVVIVLSYESPKTAKHGRWAQPIRGFRARTYPDGIVRYGGDAGCSFCYDGALSPRPFNSGQRFFAGELRRT
jgi:hypothetical protein